MVLDERDGTQLRAAAMGIPAPYDFVSSITLSADGAWLAVTALSRADGAVGRWQPAVYVTRAGEWEGGMLIEGIEALGVLTDPAALIARDVAEESVQVYPLAERGTPVHLANGGELLAVGGGRIYTRDVGDPMRILAFDAQGQQVGALALGGRVCGVWQGDRERRGVARQRAVCGRSGRLRVCCGGVGVSKGALWLVL